MIYAGIGARKTPEVVLGIMRKLGRQLAEKGWTLRSGGAWGADSAFEKGCMEGKGKKNIFRPEDATVAAMELAAEICGRSRWSHCKPYVQKLHGRNMQIILGQGLDSLVDFVLCWTERGEITGGTGVGIMTAQSNCIPVVNIADYAWGEKLKKIIENIEEVENARKASS